MIKITLDGFAGFDWAIQAARLSYDKRPAVEIALPIATSPENLSDADKELARKLIARGDSHAKFLRCIVVWLTIAAPRYWWSQFDTYKVGTTALSQSTMHTLGRRPLVREDFADGVMVDIRDSLEGIRQKYREASIEPLRQPYLDILKANLPEGFIQARGVCLNYQVLRTMYHQRKTHRLREWQEFCAWTETELPENWMITT